MPLTQSEIEDILKKTLPDLRGEDISKAARTILAAAGEWQEVDVDEKLGAGMSIQCKDICALGEAYSKGVRIRAFIARTPS
ncbi:MAG: hypothetical protein Q8Q08_10335 [Candidatus Omnitrophota bacterium]|nr:hypothetical protein [Candidatus Omnitrophota bacterium]MDZ4242893.1 hypothetical protein [Candidatus Omnitrophota bacterium]